MIPKESKN